MCVPSLTYHLAWSVTLALFWSMFDFPSVLFLAMLWRSYINEYICTSRKKYKHLKF